MNISGTAGRNRPIPSSKESGKKCAPDEIGTVENGHETKENCVVQQGGAVPEKNVFSDVSRGCGVLRNGIQGVEGYIKPLKVLEHIPMEG